MDKVARYYEECSDAAKDVIPNHLTYFEERIMVSVLKFILLQIN